jgi:hypothetical protein
VPSLGAGAAATVAFRRSFDQAFHQNVMEVERDGRVIRLHRASCGESRGRPFRDDGNCAVAPSNRHWDAAPEADPLQRNLNLEE